MGHLSSTTSSIILITIIIRHISFLACHVLEVAQKKVPDAIYGVEAGCQVHHRPWSRATNELINKEKALVCLPQPLWNFGSLTALTCSSDSRLGSGISLDMLHTSAVRGECWGRWRGRPHWSIGGQGAEAMGLTKYSENHIEWAYISIHVLAWTRFCTQIQT